MTILADTPRNFVDQTPNPSPKLPLNVDFIFYSDIPTGPRILYAFLVKKSTELDFSDGGISIPMEVLGHKLNISYATIWKYVKKLEEYGWLRVEQNTAGHNRYYVSHLWVEA